ncbi:SDR family NAD(P)-dependent oxidoreductase [Wenyingzhuangia sp. IMCC45467]
MKTALITGATSGIGKELAYIHAKHKGNLVLVARNFNTLLEMKNDIESIFKVSVYIIQKDLTYLNASQEVYTEVISQNIVVNYLINNAGFGGVGKFYERDLYNDLNMIQLNVVSLTALTHFFLKDFVARNEGKILNVSSTASLMSGPLQAVYFATKAYVTSFSNAISEELSDTNITVTNLMPGATQTNFGAVSGMNKTALFKKPANANKVATEGYNAMLDGKIDLISGVGFKQKLMMKLLPFISKKNILKQVKKLQETKINLF